MTMADVEVVVSGYESLAAESTSTAAKGNAARCTFLSLPYLHHLLTVG